MTVFPLTSRCLPLPQASLPKAKIKQNEFADRYCEGSRFSALHGAKNQEELNRLITGTVMIRRRKAQVLPQLPPKRRQQVYLRLSAAEAGSIKAQSDQLAAISSIVAQKQGGGLSSLSKWPGLDVRVQEDPPPPTSCAPAAS